MSKNDDELDALLRLRELDAPAEFTKTVMTSIQQDTAFEHKPELSLSDVVQWLALTVGGIYGMAQSLYFLFGIWFVTATG